MRKSRYSDILDMVEGQAERCGDAIAFEDSGDLKLSYREVAAKVRGLGASLAAHGVRRDTRVAIVLPNGVDMALALLGVTATAIAVPLNPDFRSGEFRSYFGQTRVGFLIVREGDGTTAREVAAQMGIAVLELSGDGRAVLPDPACRDQAEAADGGTCEPPLPNDIAAIILTTGTTDRPKLAMLSHRNICLSARDVCLSLKLGSRDRLLCMSKQHYIGGLCTLMTAPMFSGGTVIYTSGFDPAEFYRLMALKSPTWLRLAPAMLHQLVAHAAMSPVEAKGTSLRLIRTGGAALSRQLAEEAENLFGVPVIQTYGMTESGAQITAMPLPPANRKPGSSGQATGLEVAIHGPGGAEMPVGEIGEIVTRGDNIFLGYEGDPKATAKALRGGWFHTGDLGYLDQDGDLFLKGRLKSMINRGGEKVNPHEVDDVLMSHPAVAQAASLAVKHRTLGEDVAAAVVPEPSASVTGQELRSFVATRLASYKIPQRVMFLDRMPLGLTQKIDRAKLSEMLEAAPVASAKPASDLEARIARVWAAELGLVSVGPEDNFYAIGGDSISGVRVFLAVEKAFGQPLPDDALVNITTVREMARLIEAAPAALPEYAPETTDGELTVTEKRSIAAVMAMGRVAMARSGSAINVINPGGSRPPLFWCFNSPGKDMAGLAPHLDPEQPLYGLYSGGKLLERSDAMVAKIARFYADEIVALKPDGPYVIGGNCRGGKVALEITRLLTASGREVEKLCLLEYTHTDLYDFNGQLMLMFGKQSKHMAYRNIGYGSKGWDKLFRQPPVVTWALGPHGRYFQSHNMKPMMRQLDRFLKGRPLRFSRASGIEPRLVMAIHKAPRLFAAYRKLWRRLDRVLSGKRNKLDRYTGELRP